MPRIVGIDLGTTNSLIAIVDNGVPRVIEGPDGSTKDWSSIYRHSTDDRPENFWKYIFVSFFRVDEGAEPTEYQAGIPQVLRLMNSPQLTATGLVNGLVRENKTPEEAIEHLYLATLSRRPTPQERDKLLAYVKKGSEKDAYADIAWALLNSSEFTLNH